LPAVGRAAWLHRFQAAIGRAAATLRISPTGATLLAVAVSAVGAWLLYEQRFIAAAIVVAAGAALDGVDGAVARATNRVTLRGGYLDSLLDRFVDFLVLLAIMAGYDQSKYWIVGSVALFGAITTSFARARIYQDLRPSEVPATRELLERPERYYILLPAILAQGILDRIGHDFEVLFWALVVLAVLSVLTVVQRMVRALRVLGDHDRA
jgi:phosphatidylglycerophosphate synthase